MTKKNTREEEALREFQREHHERILKRLGLTAVEVKKLIEPYKLQPGLVGSQPGSMEPKAENTTKRAKNSHGKLRCSETRAA